MVIAFAVPGIPIGQPKGQAVLMGGHARIVPAGRSHPIHVFRATVRLAAERAYQGAPTESAVELRVFFLLPRPRSRVWKTKPMPREWHIGRPDTDNLLKGVKDSLKGLFWRDDSQVAREVVEKMVCAGDEQPGVTVTVEWLDSREARPEPATASLFLTQDQANR